MRGSIAVESHPKYSFTSLTRTGKFVLRDEKTIEQLIHKLSIWNDSLDKMTSGLDQELSRRRLKIQLSTSDTNQLQQLEVAATVFEHPDLQRMACVRNVIRKKCSERQGDATYISTHTTLTSWF